jgi:cytochrome b6-f complex iron-sulfur subunit
MTDNGTDFVALSDVCTHLGCRVRFDDGARLEGSEGFFCPCHNGVFGKDGEVMSGPMPRPMDRLNINVVDGEIFVREA